MEPFDKKRCLDNIYFLAKQKGKKIGELEELAGVSTGYLSRANKEDNTSKLTIDLIAIIAQVLEVSIDKLVYYDLASISANERKVIDFIEKLGQDTEQGSIDWEKNPPVLPTAIECYSDGTTSECLFLCKNGEPYYHSYFFPGHNTRQVGDFFTYALEDDVRVIFTKVKHAEAEGEDYELYFLVQGDYNNPSSVEPVCGTCPARETLFDAALKKLYEIVDDSCRNVRLSPVVRRVIDRFMRDPLEAAPASDDGELPF